jgi:hypothetical protein
VGFFGELYAGAGRDVFGVYKAWVFKRRYWTWVVDIRGGAVCVAWFSFDWRLFMAALGGGMAGGFMPTWMRAVAILQSLGRIFTHLPTLARFRDGIRRGATGAGICGLWRYIGAGCLWGITTEGVERCWRSAWGACL